MCTYAVEEYMETFDKVDYVQTFKGLKMRFEQERDRQNRKTIDRFLSFYLLCNSCFILLPRYFESILELYLPKHRNHSRLLEVCSLGTKTLPLAIPCPVRLKSLPRLILSLCLTVARDSFEKPSKRLKMMIKFHRLPHSNNY